jgi:hypothetical protein
MAEERRRAVRSSLPESIPATISGISVRLIELSAIGARVEHEERLPIGSSEVRFTWRGEAMKVPARIVRSEISGRRDSRLVYSSGIHFPESVDATSAVIASILQWAAGVPQEESTPVEETAAQPSTPAAEAPVSTLDDSWRRRTLFVPDDSDDDLPFAQFRFIDGHWVKDYVESPDQPDDGFTIPRDQTDFPELQKTFELADEDTRRMMRIAMGAKLASEREAVKR